MRYRMTLLDSIHAVISFLFKTSLLLLRIRTPQTLYVRCLCPLSQLPEEIPGVTDSNLRDVAVCSRACISKPLRGRKYLHFQDQTAQTSGVTSKKTRLLYQHRCENLKFRNINLVSSSFGCYWLLRFMRRNKLVLTTRILKLNFRDRPNAPRHWRYEFLANLHVAEDAST
jgi:hypothetical protein